MTFGSTAVQIRAATHIDIYDHVVRAAWSERFGVTDAQLRKAVRMVGSRITTLSSHLRRPSGS
ncbi:DUF3606 domain-containing protein [Methylobacterium sp. CM6257]